MDKSNIELAVDVLVAALQSGKLTSYQPDDVAAFFKIIHAQICSSKAIENHDYESPVLNK